MSAPVPGYAARHDRTASPAPAPAVSLATGAAVRQFAAPDVVPG
jgi:hypothetical protein